MHSKKLIHTLKSKLSTEHQISIKNSHIHELIASWNGYKSKASMDISGAFVFDDFSCSEESDELDLFFSRGASLGYSRPELIELNNEIIITLDELNLSFIRYEDLNMDIPDREEIHCINCEELINSYKTNKTLLIGEVKRGSSAAAYSLASFYQGIENTSHTGVFYKALKEFEETGNEAYEWLLEAEKLGSIDAKSDLALHYGMSEFLAAAAEHGNKDCIDEIARQERSPEKIHYWNELAELYGHDITSSEGIYDGGNWFVGHEGIDLPVISEQEKNTVEIKAKATFDKYSKNCDYH